jgi:hypothetical protein
MVDFARVELSDGSFALICSTCDVIGIEHELVSGGPLWAGGTPSNRTRMARSAPR